MTPREHEILFGGDMPIVAAAPRAACIKTSWTTRILDLATRWYVPRRRDRVAAVALTAFAVVGLWLTGGLNAEIVPTQSDSPSVAAPTPLSRLVVDVVDTPNLGFGCADLAIPVTFIGGLAPEGVEAGGTGISCESN